MFFGRFGHTLDDKGRLTIPAKYRNTLATGVVITRGLDRCLYVYPSSEWGQISERIQQLSQMKKDARSFVRFLFAEATDSIPDKQGRVLIPAFLREYADLSDDVIVAGSYNRLEIWNPDAYQQENSRLEQDADALAEQLSELGIL
jgi:MraZ protein